VSVLRMKSRTNGAGELHLHLGVPDSDVSVTVELPEGTKGMSDEQKKQDWTEFVRRTAGSISDPTFQRPPQGEYPKRESMK